MKRKIVNWRIYSSLAVVALIGIAWLDSLHYITTVRFCLGRASIDYTQGFEGFRFDACFSPNGIDQGNAIERIPVPDVLTHIDIFPQMMFKEALFFTLLFLLVFVAFVVKSRLSTIRKSAKERCP
jgi:hypothetical protein